MSSDSQNQSCRKPRNTKQFKKENRETILSHNKKPPPSKKELTKTENKYKYTYKDLKEHYIYEIYFLELLE